MIYLKTTLEEKLEAIKSFDSFKKGDYTKEQLQSMLIKLLRKNEKQAKYIKTLEKGRG